jgi:hypothetical protein
MLVQIGRLRQALIIFTVSSGNLEKILFIL